MANDGDAGLHHEHHQPVDFATIQQEIITFGTKFTAFLDTLTQLMQFTPSEPMTTMTTTSASRDGANDDYQGDNHQQPVNLLALQQAIKQTMSDMQLFLASLSPTCNNTTHQNAQSHDGLILTK